MVWNAASAAIDPRLPRPWLETETGGLNPKGFYDNVDEGYLYPSFIDDPRWIKIRKLALDAKMSLLRDIGS